MNYEHDKPTDNIKPLLDTIVKHIPAPKIEEGNTQMLVTSLDFSKYTGRIAIGRLQRGEIKKGQFVTLMDKEGLNKKHQVKSLFVFDGLGKKEVTEVHAGVIFGVSGIEGFDIGDTIAHEENPEALVSIDIDEPTMSMQFVINDSPFFGQDGKYVTSRHIKDRLEAETEKNLAMRVEPTATADAFKVFGRGVLHLSVLVETMRREGYELQISQPQVIIKEIDGRKHEPIEELTLDLPEVYSGKAIEMITKRKGMMLSMNPKGDRMLCVFEIPSRGIIGLRNFMLTATAGEAIMNHRFKEFQPWKGDIPGRQNGSLISMETGKSIPFSMFNLQDRGKFFVPANQEIYQGQIVGEHIRPGDLVINLTKTKKLTNMRSSGADDKVKLTPPVLFTLEEALEYIQGDEYVEVTPNNMRIRKIHLQEKDRKRAKNAIASKV